MLYLSWRFAFSPWSLGDATMHAVGGEEWVYQGAVAGSEV